MAEIDVELLWFSGCPNHVAARTLLHELLDEIAPGTDVRDIDASDPTVAERLRFPGSPTIRVNGDDVVPGFRDPGDYTPRCRVFHTPEGLRGVPDRSWIEAALLRARSAAEDRSSSAGVPQARTASTPT
jgi:hypothetical protein